MNTLHRMLLRGFLSILLISLLFFVLMVELLDLFTNLWRYLAQGTPVTQILHIAWLYLPKCLSYAGPPALLFSCAYALGLLYKNNELIAVLGSGVSLIRFLLPLLLLGVLLSVGSFWFEERVVIDSVRRKNELYRATVRMEVSLSNTNVTVLSADTRTVYQVDYYNDKKQALNGVLVLGRDAEGKFSSRLDAETAEWNGANWVLHNVRRYLRSPDGVEESLLGVLSEPWLSEPPATFRKTSRRVDEMDAAQARDWIGRLRRAGLPYREAQTEYYRKFFYSFSPFIVMLIASGVGGRFRRNVLLASLLASLLLSVVYYVGQMVSVILAKNGMIPPLAGAGFSFVVFLAMGIVLLRTART